MTPVCFVILLIMRIGLIFSSLATTATGSGTTLGYLGRHNHTKPHMIWLKQLGRILDTLSSLRWFSPLHGIFGHKGMGRYLGMSNLLFVLGEGTSFMTFLFCLTGLNVNIRIV